MATDTPELYRDIGTSEWRKFTTVITNKEIASIRNALAPAGKIWITNVSKLNLLRIKPDLRLWIDIEEIGTALDSQGHELTGLIALYGRRINPTFK